jgi:hypothetical protein
MGLASKHPAYDAQESAWQKCRDCYEGEDQVKSQGTDYLPPTSGQIKDGLENPALPGYKAYEAYRTRARFPDTFGEAVRSSVGALHFKPAVIELPAALEPLRDAATVQGESLQLLLRRINEAQLVTGRIGLLLDLAGEEVRGAVLPRVATYEAESVGNWDDGAVDDPTIQTLNLVVLDESGPERKPDLSWEEVKRFRVLVLGAPEENEARGLYRQAVFEGVDDPAFDPSKLFEPKLRGKTLEQIPFVFINSSDLLSDPVTPRLLGLANQCLGIYRGEADYRQSLFMQGQDTLVIKGQRVTGKEGEPIRVGAGATIGVESDGDAKFIGTNSGGIPEQRQAIENDKREAAEMGGQLLDSTSREKESGEALKVRVAAQTATLKQVAMTAAEGLQTLLRICAKWVGADPKEVVVKPNLDFGDLGLMSVTLTELNQLVNNGNLSRLTMLQIMQKRGQWIEGLTPEEEIKRIAEFTTGLEDQPPETTPPAEAAD